MPTSSPRLHATRRPAILALALMAALAAAPARAQSSATMYGLIDMSVGSFHKVPGDPSMKAADSGKMSTSYWGIKTTDDLGDGLTAQVVIEGFMRNDNGAAGRFDGDTFFARNSWVALAGRFGSVSVGRNTTSLFVNTLVFNAFGDSFGFSPSIRHYFTAGKVSPTLVTGDTGWSDSVKYNSPNYGGLSVNATVAAGEGNGGRNLAGSATYLGGPLGLGLAWQQVEKGATTPDTTTWQMSGSYALGAAKLYAQYGKVTVDHVASGANYKLSDLGAEYTIGLGKLLLQWGHVSPSTGPSRTTVSLGYDYLLSKRTDVYAVYMADRESAQANASNYGVGIRHRF